MYPLHEHLCDFQLHLDVPNDFETGRRAALAGVVSSEAEDDLYRIAQPSTHGQAKLSDVVPLQVQLVVGGHHPWPAIECIAMQQDLHPKAELRHPEDVLGPSLTEMGTHEFGRFQAPPISKYLFPNLTSLPRARCTKDRELSWRHSVTLNRSQRCCMNVPILL